jgi:hypothetical protein
LADPFRTSLCIETGVSSSCKPTYTQRHASSVWSLSTCSFLSKSFIYPMSGSTGCISLPVLEHGVHNPASADCITILQARIYMIRSAYSYFLFVKNCSAMILQCSVRVNALTRPCSIEVRTVVVIIHLKLNSPTRSFPRRSGALA